MKILIFLLLAFLLAAHSQKKTYTLQLLPTERGARCLDGSPAGFYYHEGAGINKKKFLIYMQDGGACLGTTREQVLESCYERSKTPYGSTNLGIPELFNGVLATNKIENPVFSDWTKIFLVYCDGSMYTGSLAEPIQYKETKLYFRGYNISLETFRYLSEKFDMYNGDTIVLSGKSAGGLGAFFYSNHLLENTKTAKVFSIPDSGLFPDSPAFRFASTHLIELIYSEGNYFPIQECFQDQNGDKMACYNASNLAKYSKVPTMMIQSLYDSYTIAISLRINCLTSNEIFLSLEKCDQKQRAAIEALRKTTIFGLQIFKGNRTDVGVWAPSCSNHVFTNNLLTESDYSVPQNGLTVSDAISSFLACPEKAPWLIDQKPWPFNRRCSGKSTFHLRTMG